VEQVDNLRGARSSVRISGNGRALRIRLNGFRTYTVRHSGVLSSQQPLFSTILAYVRYRFRLGPSRGCKLPLGQCVADILFNRVGQAHSAFEFGAFMSRWQLPIGLQQIVDLI